MKNSIEERKKRVMRRRRFTEFMKGNGIYIAVFLCLAMIGGLIAFLPAGGTKSEAGRIKDEPAGHSYDEKLGDITPSPTALPIRTPRPTAAITPTAEPTLMPELTPAPTKAPAEDAPVKLNSPVDGKLLKPYSMDALIYSKTLRQWMTHSGVDIAAPKGAEVRSIAAGTVTQVYDDDMLGTTVVIDHGSYKSVCSGLKKEVAVKVGDALESRALIGCVGDTAISECADQSHLHFEIWVNGAPEDPEEYVLIARDA